MHPYKYFSDLPALLDLSGASNEEIIALEQKTGKKLPLSLKEYLLLMGKSRPPLLFREWSYHGIDDMAYIHEWLYELIEGYREQGVEEPLERLNNVIPFFHFQDTFFFVHEDQGDDPPVYAFDIGDKPDVRQVSPSFMQLIRERFKRLTMI
jgi:hypothetical protein